MTPRVLRTWSIGSLILAACSSSPNNSTPGQSLAIASGGSALYLAEPDEGLITIVPLDGGSGPSSIQTTGEPTRIARVNGRVFVTLRAERAVAVYNERAGTLVLDRKIDVGAEPYGIAVRSDGARIYVVSSLSGTVDELDGASYATLRTWSVDDEPRWIAIHPTASALYIGSAMKGTLTHIDLGSGRVEKVAIATPLGSSPDVSVRITGDLAVSPDGRMLAVPTMFVDNQTTVVEVQPNFEQTTSSGGYNSTGADGTPARFRPSVVAIQVDDLGNLAANSAHPIATGLDSRARGYVASVAFSPDSAIMAASVEGASSVVAMLLVTPEVRDGEQLAGSLFVPSNPHASFQGMRIRPSFTLLTATGPRGVAFTNDSELRIFAFIDRVIATQDLSGLRHSTSVGSAVTPSNVITIGKTQLQDQIDLGRRLFYAADNARMSSPGSAVSCGTCHFEGRNDGLTWHFTRGLRQTPSLAGQISLTAPVRWEGDRPTVAADALETSQGPMGGRGLELQDAQAIAAFLDARRDVDVQFKGSTDDAATRGKALFERPAVGCATCHNGARLTDNLIHPLFGLDQVKTRSLVGIAASAPYLHDGSAPTLHDVLLRSKNREMGDASMLSDQELDDLEAYLRTL